MTYLHSRNILFRDLKPDNILVWDFPQPREQWNPSANILVKLADYGISKQISPQGIHSKAGTPQFLPPEVLLHSEHEAASLKVDVYSFGMVMYYLFNFGNPFSSGLLVGSQLRHSRRPELPTKVLSTHSRTRLKSFNVAWCVSAFPPPPELAQFCPDGGVDGLVLERQAQTPTLLRPDPLHPSWRDHLQPGGRTASGGRGGDPRSLRHDN